MGERDCVAALVERGEVGVGKVRAMGEDRAGHIEQAGCAESLDESAAESLARDSLIDRVFGRVDVDADAEPLGEIDAAGERFFLHREAGMAPTIAAKRPSVALLAQRRRSARFPPDPVAAFIRPVAVGHFVAQARRGNRPRRCRFQAP